MRGQLLGRPDHLAAIERLLRVGERLGHPVVHPEVEVRHDEHGSLEALGEVERVHGERVALLDGARQDEDVERVPL